MEQKDLKKLVDQLEDFLPGDTFDILARAYRDNPDLLKQINEEACDRYPSEFISDADRKYP